MQNQSLSKLAYNTKETIEILSMNRNLLESYRKRGLIKALKVGRNYLYPRDELIRFLNNFIGSEITKDGIVIKEC